MKAGRGQSEKNTSKGPLAIVCLSAYKSATRRCRSVIRRSLGELRLTYRSRRGENQ
jgi:hypothetical protein